MSVKDYPSQEGYGRIGYVVLSGVQPDTYVVIRDCTVCGKEARVTVPGPGLWAWEHGKFAQDAFPQIRPEEREMLISGTHPECWDRMWADDEDYEEVGDFGALAPRRQDEEE